MALFQNFSSSTFEENELPQKPFHLVLVIDQNYFQSARELYLLIHPLRNCIYIAGALLRIGIATQLPSITILVYPKNANQDMETLLPTTVLANATICDIIACLERIGGGNEYQSFRHSPEIGLIDWNHFKDTLASAVQIPDREKCQVTFFNRNWAINLHLDVPRLANVDKLIIVKLNRESLLDELEPFGRTEINCHDVVGSIPIIQIDLASVPSETDHFYKKYVFNTWLSQNKEVDILLPSTTYNRSPMCLTCLAQPRMLASAIFPGLEMGESSGSSFSGRGGGASASKLRINRKIRLEAISRIKRSGICQSLLFGSQCFILTPSQKSDTIFINERRFCGLWNQLLSNDEALICRMDKNHDVSSPSGHFIVVPAPDSRLILKSIATSELLLSLNFKTSLSDDCGVTDDIDDISKGIDRVTKMDLESSLSKLQVENKFDPYQYNGGLMKILEEQAKKQQKTTKVRTTSVSVVGPRGRTRGGTRGGRRGTGVGRGKQNFIS